MVIKVPSRFAFSEKPKSSKYAKVPPDPVEKQWKFCNFANFVLPWEPESFFFACDEELRRPQADTSSAEGRRHEQHFQDLTETGNRAWKAPTSYATTR